MNFWDASAVLPLCLQEPHTLNVKKLRSSASIFFLWTQDVFDRGGAFKVG